MKTKYILGALIVANASLPSEAFANRGYQPGNCAVYAEMAAKTIKADSRVTGETQTKSVKVLTVYSDHLNGVVKAKMPETYQQAKGFGWDKAKVDQMMKDGEAAIRAGFHSGTMETDKIYTDHLLAINNCAKASSMAGDIGRDDANAIGEVMGDVFAQIAGGS